MIKSAPLKRQTDLKGQGLFREHTRYIHKAVYVSASRRLKPYRAQLVHTQDHFSMSRTELRAQGAVHLDLYLYARDHFSMSRTELRAQAAVYLELYLYTQDHFSMSRTELRAQGQQIQLGAER